MAKPISIIYEDEHLLLVNKPTGMLSIPDRFDPDKPNLYTQLHRQYEKVWVVHRIDRPTSGLICYALNEEAHRHLSLQFQQRSVEKTYLALVDGRLPKDEGSIDLRIAPNPAKAGQMIAGKTGKTALTHYRVVERFPAFTLVEVRIETGRTHQIRVHFQAIGHPLAVDELYGKRTGLFLSEIKRKGFRMGKEQEERPLLARLALHAQRITLTHPATETSFTMEAPLPKDLSAVLKQMRKWT